MGITKFLKNEVSKQRTKISGGDIISCRQLYSNTVEEFTPTFKSIIQTNHFIDKLKEKKDYFLLYFTIDRSQKYNTKMEDDK